MGSAIAPVSATATEMADSAATARSVSMIDSGTVCSHQTTLPE